MLQLIVALHQLVRENKVALYLLLITYGLKVFELVIKR